MLDAAVIKSENMFKIALVLFTIQISKETDFKTLIDIQKITALYFHKCLIAVTNSTRDCLNGFCTEPEFPVVNE